MQINLFISPVFDLTDSLLIVQDKVYDQILAGCY